MIPDDIPIIGFIDDAIMIELVVRDLAAEIDAYADFCDYKKTAPKGKAKPKAKKEVAPAEDAPAEESKAEDAPAEEPKADEGDANANEEEKA